MPTQSADKRPVSFSIATFGCKVNQYDSQVMREALRAAGCREGPPRNRTDVVIVNTCTVTHVADAKARRLIRRIARECPGCRIVVTGCGIDRDPAAFERMPGVWAVIPNTRKPEIAEVLGLSVGGAHRSTVPHEPGWCAGISGFEGHTRGFVKIQEGCDAWCTYCIVPAVRGPARSRAAASVVAEVRRLAERLNEIVLTGIHLGLYRDASGLDLAGLVRRVLDQTDVGRLRLSSIEVNEITPELVDLIAGSGRVCPHLHVPLQSGSDRVLKRMGRPYTAARFLAVLNKARDRLDRPAVTGDVMVGFPGETEEDFAETVAVCRAAAFGRMHVFPYSARPGTAAARLDGRCRTTVVSDRKQRLANLADGLSLDYGSQFVGETLKVLVETSRDQSGALCGYTPRYLRLLFDGPDSLRGRTIPVRVIEARPRFLRGEAQTEKP